MKSILQYVSIFALCSTSTAYAGGVVRLADGDCAGLAAAASAPAGQEPALIVLARNGNYNSCSFAVTGNIVIDGAGANLGLDAFASGSETSQFSIAALASLSIRQLNINTPPASGSAASPSNSPSPNLIVLRSTTFENNGTLVLDSVSVFNNTFGFTSDLPTTGAFVDTSGTLVLRNVTIAGNTSASGLPIIQGGSVVISGSTFVNNTAPIFAAGNMTISNSIVAANTDACAANIPPTSLGGNVTDDAKCGFVSTNDHVVPDVHLLELGKHGGVVDNVALRNDSPAIGNAIVGSCEATDARGYARGQSACDSGAYEFGGGSGNIAATGMSGLYFNATNDGHYVSIQRLHDNKALVIWNTFDEDGVPAWLYGVGNVSGQSIHVDQVARNTGGKLQPGGDVVGSHASVWGSIDVNLSDCYNAQLSYNSTDPEFGSGSTALQRLAFVDNVNCAP